MTEENLKTANRLLEEIRHLKSAKRDILSCLKELDLADFQTNIISFELDRKRCMVRTEKALLFLKQELNEIVKEIEVKEKEFDNL